jgi:hypothetical protein
MCRDRINVVINIGVVRVLDIAEVPESNPSFFRDWKPNVTLATVRPTRQSSTPCRLEAERDAGYCWAKELKPSLGR